MTHAARDAALWCGIPLPRALYVTPLVCPVASSMDVESQPCPSRARLLPLPPSFPLVPAPSQFGSFPRPTTATFDHMTLDLFDVIIIIVTTSLRPSNHFTGSFVLGQGISSATFA